MREILILFYREVCWVMTIVLPRSFKERGFLIFYKESLLGDNDSVAKEFQGSGRLLYCIRKFVG